MALSRRDWHPSELAAGSDRNGRRAWYDDDRGEGSPSTRHPHTNAVSGRRTHRHGCRRSVHARHGIPRWTRRSRLAQCLARGPGCRLARVRDRVRRRNRECSDFARLDSHGRQSCFLGTDDGGSHSWCVGWSEWLRSLGYSRLYVCRNHGLEHPAQHGSFHRSVPAFDRWRFVRSVLHARRHEPRLLARSQVRRLSRSLLPREVCREVCRCVRGNGHGQRFAGCTKLLRPRVAPSRGCRRRSHLARAERSEPVRCLRHRSHDRTGSARD